jgi:hypothetical protein
VAAVQRHGHPAGRRLTWQGFYAPTGRWLTMTFEPAGGGTTVCLRDGPPVPDPDATVTSVRDADRLAFLAEVTESMIATLDADAAADQLARLVVPRLADLATVVLVEPDDTVGRVARAHREPGGLAHLDAFLAEHPRGPRDQPGVLAALMAGRPARLVATDPVPGVPGTGPAPAGEAHRELDATAGLFVPLRAHGETFGVLTLVTCGARSPHTDTEIATAVEVGRRGAIALENARLYTRTLEVAETLQRSLLTPPPQPAGLQIAVRYRPAATQALVGGDFYDAFARADGVVQLVVGDVVGHDLAAAAAMSELRGAVRILAYDRDGSPAQTLTRVDRALTGLGSSALATALVAGVGPAVPGTADRDLCWSSAGHPPPLLLSADGEVRTLATVPETLLGVDPGTPRTDHRLTLCPGDTVLLYTDGLVETDRSCGLDAGVTRLADALAGLADTPLEDLCDLVLGRVLAAGPGSARTADDIALLAVRSARPAVG